MPQHGVGISVPVCAAGVPGYVAYSPRNRPLSLSTEGLGGGRAGPVRNGTHRTHRAPWFGDPLLAGPPFTGESGLKRHKGKESLGTREY